VILGWEILKSSKTSLGHEGIPAKGPGEITTKVVAVYRTFMIEPD